MSQVPLSQVLRVHYVNGIHIPSSLSFCLQSIILNRKFAFLLPLGSSIFIILYLPYFTSVLTSYADVFV